MKTVRYDSRRAQVRLDQRSCRQSRGACGCECDIQYRGTRQMKSEASLYRLPGTKTGTVPQGRDMAAYSEMKEQLMCLYFVMVELELYLDVHPDCSEAIARYKCAVKEYEELAAVFERKYGPILARNNDCANEWLWVREPWPWEV